MDNQRHILSSLLILMAFSFINIQFDQCHAQDKMNGPFKNKPANQFEKYGEGQNLFLNFYQKWISPVKGGNKCPMHPSCSQFAKISFQILPWYEAYINSLERLARCGHELYLYPEIRIKDTIRWYDPVLIKELKHEDKITKDTP